MNMIETTPEGADYWFLLNLAAANQSLPPYAKVRLESIAAALLAARRDTERLNWLDADAQRVHDLFGDLVRADAGESIRQLIDTAATPEPK